MLSEFDMGGGRGLDLGLGLDDGGSSFWRSHSYERISSIHFIETMPMGWN